MTTIDRESAELEAIEDEAEARVAAILIVAHQRFAVALKKVAGARDRRGAR